MSYLLPNYARQPVEFTHGIGSYVWDSQEQMYLDFTSGIGVQNLGHRPEAVEAKLQQQLQQLWHSPNLYQNSLQENLAEKLGRQYDFRSFFCNSGAEANEAALKFVRKASGRQKIVTFADSFHGRTYGAMSATGQEKIQTGFAPLLPGFTTLPYNDCTALDNLDASVAAVMLELVQGEGGVIPAEQAWVQSLVAKCHANDILIVIDEIQTGIGRTGTFFAFEQYNFVPDVVTLAKALGNGLPVGALLAKAEYAETFGPGSHGTTFGGNLLAMTAANEVVDTIQQPAFLTAVNEKAEFFWTQLAGLTNLPGVKMIRGSGLMIGIQVAAENVPTIISQCQAEGLLVLRAGQDVIRLLPPLTVKQTELQHAVDILTSVLQSLPVPVVQ